MIPAKRGVSEGRVRTEVVAGAIRLQNGSNPSLRVRTATGALVGQLVKLRPIVNRPLEFVHFSGGGSSGEASVGRI
jgi:hypothetical protein